MPLKIQTDEQVVQWMADKNISGFVGDYYLQAQLEADLKEYDKLQKETIRATRSWVADVDGWMSPRQVSEAHNAVIREILSKLARTIIGEERSMPSGTAIWFMPDDDYQALKQKYGGE